MSRKVVCVPSIVTVLIVGEACGMADGPSPFAESMDCCPYVNVCNEKKDKDLLAKFDRPMIKNNLPDAETDFCFGRDPREVDRTR